MTEKTNVAVDLSHHLSRLAKSRKPSPLKGLQKYMRKPGLISLAGGLPNPSCFPYSSISADIFLPDSLGPLPEEEKASALSWLWRLFGTEKEKTTHISIAKYSDNPDDLTLADALQYRPATGLPQLASFIKDFTLKVYRPAYEDFATLIHTGNTDGWSRAVATFCNSGEMVLMEEWTYPSAKATMLPLGVNCIPVAMDGEGMRSDSLRELLIRWDEKDRGAARPHVLYTVPVGQNPSGSTMGSQRKQEIYDICVEYDIIIVEDDPYYFFQEGKYVPKSQRGTENRTTDTDTGEEYISRLAPSFLRYDYQGRVIRMDTFSKVIAPGSRLGWFTCNALFAERFERQGETSTQSPCGYSQALLATILNTWTVDGYVRWLESLCLQYAQRRDHFIDLVDEKFHLDITAGCDIWKGVMVYRAFPKRSRESNSTNEKDHKPIAYGKPMFSFAPPSSGMFIWLKMHFENHPSFHVDGEDTLEEKLWVKCAESGLLLGPGFMFAAEESDDNRTKGHFRISFSEADFEAMKKAVSIMADVMSRFFGAA